MPYVEQWPSSYSASSFPSQVDRGRLDIFALHLYNSAKRLERVGNGIRNGRTCRVRAIIGPLEVYHTIKTREGCSSTLVTMSI